MAISGVEREILGNRAQNGRISLKTLWLGFFFGICLSGAAASGLVDLERWNRQIKVQAVELTCIAQFGETIRNLPQG